MNQKIIRPDFIFSYWIFAWFIVYYIIQKTSNPSSFSFITQNLNPKLALIIALIENIGLLGFLLTQKTQLYVLFTFIITTTIFKIIPIYLVYDHTILFPNDIIPVVFLFIVYNIYLFIWRTNVIEVTQKTTDSLTKGKTNTPFFYLLHKLSIL